MEVINIIPIIHALIIHDVLLIHDFDSDVLLLQT